MVNLPFSVYVSVDNYFEISEKLNVEEITQTITGKEPEKITYSECGSQSCDEISKLLKHINEKSVIDRTDTLKKKQSCRAFCSFQNSNYRIFFSLILKW